MMWINDLLVGRKFNYKLGLTPEQSRLNTEALLEWCKDKDYVEGIKDYANQLKEKNKTRR